ncbi:Zn-ribbon domain-containing OB-fold protein [Piscinibacter sakaiensis]|uniref:Acetyl-CoA acetyltransferase n=1 Tax=Piscinibacter sakaiensis TaxID=1547922 RepID=A0A0K8P3G6_PISS1|nr:OB-fold domain-containing protein [Piscinibacter sakaiensis]GAP37148.1 acetyl-CoA acetyltransferase [Piscinibacter sakaiensis]
MSRPFWDGLREQRLRIQRCGGCRTWQFGPEWICHRCHAFDPAWEDVPARGLVHSWERVWHPSHPSLKGHGPYLVVLVELPHAGGVRLVGNLLGDPLQPVRIGMPVVGRFEHHAQPFPYTLLQWAPSAERPG